MWADKVLTEANRGGVGSNGVGSGPPRSKRAVGVLCLAGEPALPHFI